MTNNFVIVTSFLRDLMENAVCWRHCSTRHKMAKTLTHEESEAIFKKLRSNPANKVGRVMIRLPLTH